MSILGFLNYGTDFNFQCILFFFHSFTKSGDEDEIEHFRYAVAAACFLDVGPSQVRCLLHMTLLIQAKDVFLNGINAGVAFEKLEYFEELFLIKKGCTKKLNYEVTETIRKFAASFYL